MEHYTLAEAAALVAARRYPPDGYTETDELRLQCERRCLLLLKDSALRRVLPLTNPHTRQPFELGRLTIDFFPADLLISTDTLSRWVHINVPEAKSAFPLPERKLPASLHNIPAAPPPPRQYKFTKPDWKRWAHADTMVELWEGACLIADIEPPLSPYSSKPMRLTDLRHLPARFHEVWDMLDRDAVIRKLPEQNEAGRMLYDISMEALASWAVDRGIEAPEELLRLSVQFQKPEQPTKPGSAAEVETKADEPTGIQRGDWLRHEISELVATMDRKGESLTVEAVIKRIVPTVKTGGVIIGLIDGVLSYLKVPGEDAQDEPPLTLPMPALKKRVARVLEARHSGK